MNSDLQRGSENSLKTDIGYRQADDTEKAAP